MSKLTKVQSEKLVLETVKSMLVDGVKFSNELANSLNEQGLDFATLTDIGNMKLVTEIGLKNGWILTDQQIQKKVVDAVKNNPISHFLDISKLARNIDMHQLTLAERQQAIVRYCGAKESDMKASAKFTQFKNGKQMGNISKWIAEHPDFTPQQLHASGSCHKDGESESKNAGLYYDEYLAYFERAKEHFIAIGLIKEV